MVRKLPPVSERGTVEIERDGQVHQGHYSVSRGMLTVSLGDADKTTQLGGIAAPTLARQLLSELVREEAGR